MSRTLLIASIVRHYGMEWDMLELLVRETNPFTSLVLVASSLIMPGMTWGWIVAGICIQCVALGMAEICSSMPTSGGLYYASAVLAPPGWGPLAAWITGISRESANLQSYADTVRERVEQLVLPAY